MVLCLGDTSDKEKYMFPQKYFPRKTTKHPSQLLWKRLFHFNITHTFKGHLGCLKSGH